MKISDVKVHVMQAELKEPFGFSQWWFHKRGAMIVEVITDEGLVGWGEAYGPPEATGAIVEKLYKPLVVGKDPFQVGVIWEELYNRFRDYGQKGVMIAALSGLNIALWDLMGKALGVPVYKLLGGTFRNEVFAYATGLYLKQRDNVPKELAHEAECHVKAGFKAIKMKIGYGYERDVVYVKAVRDAIGPGVELMVDANHAYDASSAIRVGRGIEPFEIGWFEEPVPPEDIQGYIEVKDALSIPIAGGECEYTRFGFRGLLSKRAVDIVQPDTCSAGGLSECKKIAAMASAWGVRYLPHVWGSGVALAANLHLIATIPPASMSANPIEPIFEYDTTENPFRTELLLEPIIPQNGSLKIPQGPGLGIDVDRKVLNRYSCK